MTDLEIIKNKLNIVDVISSYIGQLQKAGSNYKCRCPFHQENSPSFMINPQLQIFKCFGCGKGGDVIKFIQEIERIDFKEALKISAEKAGIEINDYTENTALKNERKRILEANLLTAKYYNFIITSHKIGEVGLKYAQKRGITRKDIEKFTIGFAPNSRDNLKKFLNKKGFKDQDLLRWGLLAQIDGRIMDKFRNRLIQPILNLKGEVVGFSGRYIGQSKSAPKYLNSPETIVFKKNEILYGLYHAKEAIRKTDFVIVEEGNIDIISSHRVGVENIVAPLGTAFTLNQAKLLKKMASQIFFCFDTDTAGENALVRSIAIAEEIGLLHKVVDIRGYQDPDDLISKNPSEWIVRIGKAIDSVEYLIENFREKVNTLSLDGKNKFANFITPIINSLKNEISKAHYIKQVSSILQIKEDVYIEKYLSSSKRENLSYLKDEVKGEDTKKTKEVVSKESYLLSLIYYSKKPLYLEVNREIFQSNSLREIYEGLVEIFSEKINLESLKLRLPDDSKNDLYTIILRDLSGIEDIEKEKEIVYKSLYRDYLKRTIEQLGNFEDDESSNRINELVRELKIYS